MMEDLPASADYTSEEGTYHLYSPGEPSFLYQEPDPAGGNDGIPTRFSRFIAFVRSIRVGFLAGLVSCYVLGRMDGEPHFKTVNFLFGI